MESTSPSSLLWGVARRGPPPGGGRTGRLLERTLAALGDTREQIRAIDGLDVLDERLVGRGGRVRLRSPAAGVDVRGVAASGYELAPLLRQIDDINLELHGENVLVAVFGMGERGAPRGRAAGGRAARGGRPRRASTRRRERELRAPPPWGELAMTPREAFLGRRRSCPAERPSGAWRPSRLPLTRPAYRTCCRASA